MTLDEYQRFVDTLIVPAPSGIDLCAIYAMGLAGEAGEAVDLVKKHLHYGKPIDLNHLEEELGDVLWYLAALATRHGLRLDAVAQRNVDKLTARFPNGWSAEAAIARADKVGK